MKTEVRAAKSLGQHFLVDEGCINDMMHAIRPRAEEALLEIGPGLGALTLALLPHCKRLTALEVDRRVLNILREKAAKIGDLHLIHGDFLEFDLRDLGQKWRLVGNLPYHLSSAILTRCVTQRDAIVDAHFMLQKEVVQRLDAQPESKDYGRLTLHVQRYFETEALFDVPASAFSPPPKVESAVIRLTTRAMPAWQVDDEHRYASIVQSAFSQRRKMLRQSLKSFFDAADWEALPIDGRLRPEALRGEDFALLSNYQKTR